MALRRLTTTADMRAATVPPEDAALLSDAVTRRRSRSAPKTPEQEALTSFSLNRKVKAWLSLRRYRLRAHGFHPSELYKLCPVQFYFLDAAHAGLGSEDPEVVRSSFTFLEQHLATKTREFSPESKMEMRKGDDIHDDVKFELGVLGYLWGEWHCPHCGLKATPGWMPRCERPDVNGEPIIDAAPCVRCGGKNYRYDEPWLYGEPEVRSAEWGIVGSVDGDLRITRSGVERRYILEIKSINEAGFDGKYGGGLPKPEHVLQASIYAWLMDRTHIYFVYVSKNQNNRWKEIVVPRDETAVALAKANIKAVLDARAASAPPLDRRVCGGPEDKRARLCAAVERCFGCKPPSNFWGA